MRGIFLHKLPRGGNLEIGKRKTRSHRTTDKRVVSRLSHFGCEPIPRTDHRQKCVISVRPRAELNCPVTTTRTQQMEKERISGVKMPEFIALESVEAGNLPRLEKEIDGSGI